MHHITHPLPQTAVLHLDKLLTNITCINKNALKDNKDQTKVLPVIQTQTEKKLKLETCKQSLILIRLYTRHLIKLLTQHSFI